LAAPSRTATKRKQPTSSVAPSTSRSQLKSTRSAPIDPVTITFNSKGGSSVASVVVSKDAAVAAPANPTRNGYTFGGWFRGTAGLTWLEPEAVEFPFVGSENLTLHAYWEPLVSKTRNYSDNETYFSTLPSVGRTILNPLTYEMSHEDSLMADMGTALFTTEVDWAKAIANGVADFVGDFSKIESNEFSVEALDFIWITLGATGFPTDIDGDDHTIDGLYNREGASQIKSTEWTYEIREDIFFEDGTQVTADTYEYTLKQFLDPCQNNFRSTGYYKDVANPNGYPIAGAAEYRKQTMAAPVAWSTVGFEVVDDFTFTITTWESISQASALGFGNMRLVQPEVYQESLDDNGVNSNYGTPANPYRSYGAYIIKSWDENQRMVLNKNFEYIYKEVVTYKSIVYEFTATPADNMNLFENGQLSAVGLIGEFYAEYAENPNVKTSWTGFPQYLIVNTAPSSVETNPHQKSPITTDERFRQALFFGFNRALYNSTIYAPNAPSVLPVPQDIKGYTQDPLTYMESPQHELNLEGFGIAEGTFGFDPERAVELFEAALADFRTEYPALTGPINLKLIVNDNALNLSLANWIKNAYETLFNTTTVLKDKLVVNVVSSTTAATNAARAAWDFDLILINLGFGGSTGVQWQYPGIAYIGALIGAAGFGLNLPYTSSFDAAGLATEINLLEDEDSWMNAPLNIDLTVTYEFLESLGEEFVYELEVDEEGELVLDDDGETIYVNPGHAKLYDALLEDGDKPAGIYTGSIYDLADNVFVLDSPYDGSAVAPFPGATEEVWNIVQAFEEVFFEQMPLIPTATSQSAILYADNVEIWWPKYSTAFGWGASRYRYLTTDADFINGLFNSFAEPALVAA
jgi:oligopeptide transport system substrate-binding protein